MVLVSQSILRCFIAQFIYNFHYSAAAPPLPSLCTQIAQLIANCKCEDWSSRDKNEISAVPSQPLSMTLNWILLSSAITFMSTQSCYFQYQERKKHIKLQLNANQWALCILVDVMLTIQICFEPEIIKSHTSIEKKRTREINWIATSRNHKNAVFFLSIYFSREYFTRRRDEK